MEKRKGRREESSFRAGRDFYRGKRNEEDGWADDRSVTAPVAVQRPWWREGETNFLSMVFGKGARRRKKQSWDKVFGQRREVICGKGKAMLVGGRRESCRTSSRRWILCAVPLGILSKRLYYASEIDNWRAAWPMDAFESANFFLFFFRRGRREREWACIRESDFEEKFEKRAMNFERDRKRKERNEFDKLFFFLFKSPGIKFGEKFADI